MNRDYYNLYRNGQYMGALFPDDDEQNPCEDFDMLGKMVCWHQHYNLGHEQPDVTPKEYFWQLVANDETAVSILKSFARKQDRLARSNGSLPSSRNSDYYSNGVTDWADEYDLSAEWLLNRAGWIVLPLFLYDHSGITINTTGFYCPWDSGQVGFIYATREAVIKEYGSFSKEAQEQARKLLIGEVATYDMYLTGDVWGYRAGKIPDEIYAQLEADEIDEDEIDFDDLIDEDSCWGFYGQDYAKEELHSVVDHMAKEVAEIVA